ncbi:DMT family transporter [Calidifontibacter terrae]
MRGGSRAHSIALIAAFVCGALLALQSRLNGIVAGHTGQPLVAALWSFGSGLMVLTVALAFSARLRQGARNIRLALRDHRLRWWQCLGGVCGGLLVAVQAWSVPLVGVAIFSVGVVGGQTLNALAVDRFGLGPAGVQRVTAARTIAAAVAVIGVVVSATAHRGEGGFAVLPALCASW